MNTCRKMISIALQLGVANQMRSAGKPPGLMTEVSYIAPSAGERRDDQMSQEVALDVAAVAEAAQAAEAATQDGGR